MSRYKLVTIPILFCAAVCFTINANAQDNSISGIVQDENNNPVQNATVTLLIYPDIKSAGTTQTDSNGVYHFYNTAEGKYVVLATAVAMKINQSLPFDFSGNGFTVASIIMKINRRQLKKVTINGKKTLLEVTEGKIIYNIEKSITASGSTAFEQLRRAPGISVDQDENILYKGSGNVNVMIDGKMTYLSSQQLSIMLKGMPAENLKSIEVINIPSSQYDAAGNAGIINIITKKANGQGYALNVSAGAGAGRYIQSTENIVGNLRTRRFNLFGNYSYNYNHSYLYRTSYRVIDNTIFDRRSYDPSKASNNSYKSGIDFYINKKQQIGFAYSGYNNKWSRDAIGPTYLRNLSGNIDSIVQNHNITHEPAHNNAFNLNYQAKPDTAGSVISIDADYARYNNNSFGTQGNGFFNTNNEPLQPYQQLLIQQPGITTIRSIKTDATVITKKLKLKSGLKYSYVTADNDYRYDSLINSQYQKSFLLSNHFIYTEHIYAGYLSAAKEWESVDLNTGVRLEKTNSEGNSITSRLVTKRKYTDWFPFVSVSKIINQNNKATISVTRRINRPVYSDLNPARYFFDKYSYYLGNPFLQPEYSWNTSFTYTFKDKYIATISYVQTNKPILNFALQDSITGELIVSTYNFAHKENYDFLLIIPFAAGRFWDVQNTIGLSYLSYLTASGKNEFKPHKFSIDISSVQTFTLPGKTSFELSAEYTSPTLDGVYIKKNYFNTDGGFKRAFLHKKFDVKIAFTDLFKTNHYWGYSIFNGANVRYNHTGDSRRINVNISYHLGGKLSAGKEHRLEEEQRL